MEKLRCGFECPINVNTINGAENCKLFLQENVTIVFFQVINKQVLPNLFTPAQHLTLREFLQYLLGEEAVERSVPYACSCYYSLCLYQVRVSKYWLRSSLCISLLGLSHKSSIAFLWTELFNYKFLVVLTLILLMWKIR